VRIRDRMAGCSFNVMSIHEYRHIGSRMLKDARQFVHPTLQGATFLTR